MQALAAAKLQICDFRKIGKFDNSDDLLFSGKARRLKQAKDEATEEIEKYRGEREKQFKDFETKVK